MQQRKWENHVDPTDPFWYTSLELDRYNGDEELAAITLALQAWRPIEDETLPEEDRVRWSNARRNLLHDLGLEMVVTP